MNDTLIVDIRSIFDTYVKNEISYRTTNDKIKKMITTDHNLDISRRVMAVDSENKIYKLYQFLNDDQEVLKECYDEYIESKQSTKVLINSTLTELSSDVKQSKTYNHFWIDFAKDIQLSDKLIDKFIGKDLYPKKYRKLVLEFIELKYDAKEELCYFEITNQNHFYFNQFHSINFITTFLSGNMNNKDSYFLHSMFNPYHAYACGLSPELSNLNFFSIESLNKFPNLKFDVILPYYISNTIWINLSDFDPSDEDPEVKINNRIKNQKKFITVKEYNNAIKDKEKIFNAINKIKKIFNGLKKKD